MGLKCSLLGHSFGDAAVERDREERGDEVVTVVREVEHCVRCDETRVVSENKEVTSVVEPGEVGVAEETATPRVDAGTGAGVDAGPKNEFEEYEPPDDPAEEDAEIIDEDAPDRDPGEWPDEADGFEPGTLTAEEPGATDAADGPDAAESDASDEEVLDADADGERRSGSITVPAGEYVCPECGFRTDPAGSSLRAGDACPECQRGYLREDGERNS